VAAAQEVTIYPAVTAALIPVVAAAAQEPWEQEQVVEQAEQVS
jgi:hypothetical protein